MMLLSFQMHVATYSYPHLSLALFLFAASLISLSLGYATIGFVQGYFKLLPPKRSYGYQISLTRLRRVQWWLIAISISIVLMNFAAYGMPPVFSFWGVETLNYVEYGKLKQVLNTATMALFVSASFEDSRKRKALIYSFSLLCMLAYATRGFLLVMLAQGLFAFSLRTTAKKRTLYSAAFGTVIAAVLVSDLIGNGRSGSTTEAFVGFFGIRDAYANWPMALLWVISYVATPFSNLCWIIQSYPYKGPTLTFLGSLLPAFWSPVPLEAGYLGSTNIIDGVHTYLAKYYLDLSYFGIFLINYMWGLVSGFLQNGNRLARNPLTSAVFLAAITFIFFADFLTFLSIVMELAVLAFIQRYTVRWLPRLPTSDGNTLRESLRRCLV
jgi:hypothetical protein